MDDLQYSCPLLDFTLTFPWLTVATGLVNLNFAAVESPFCLGDWTPWCGWSLLHMASSAANFFQKSSLRSSLTKALGFVLLAPDLTWPLLSVNFFLFLFFNSFKENFSVCCTWGRVGLLSIFWENFLSLGKRTRRHWKSSWTLTAGDPLPLPAPSLKFSGSCKFWYL